MLDNADHTMNDLFAQLGLPNSDSEIEAFIKEKQLMFIEEEWKLDAVWALVIDELNTRLHEDVKPA